MAASHSTEIADPPDTFKSPVWEHFGFPVEYRNGIRVVDKAHTICRNCFTKLSYTTGNTSNMQAHLRRHHPNIDISGTRKKPQKQETFPTAFRMKLQANSDRAQTITKAIGVFMALDMRPFSVVELSRYQLPSRPHFSQNVLPHLYSEVRAKLVEDLINAKFIALTTDGWTSRATQSFMTITAHYITDNWVIKNPVLQTRAVYESHTSDHLSEILQGAVAEWKIDRENATIPVITDNAKNIVNAVEAAGFSPNIRCFAHTVNLASQKGMGVNQMSRLLGRVRKVVTFFHRSTTAAAVLKDKQEMLQLPPRKLIQDVPTRWNSGFYILRVFFKALHIKFVTCLEQIVLCTFSAAAESVSSAIFSDALVSN